MKNKYLAWFVSYMAVAVVRLLGVTLKFRHHGREHLDAAMRDYPGYLFSFWHQNIVACALGQQNGKHVVMVSRSRSADPIAIICENLGHTVVRGSSSKRGRDKGGRAAKIEMLEVLKNGTNGAVAADGPTGPPEQAKPGIVDMAAETGFGIIPLSAKANRYWQFNSWDKMQLPKPFSTIDVYFDKAIHVPSNASQEEKQAILARVNQATSKLVAHRI